MFVQYRLNITTLIPLETNICASSASKPKLKSTKCRSILDRINKIILINDSIREIVSILGVRCLLLHYGLFESDFCFLAFQELPKEK